MRSLSVVGLGKLGLCTAACFASKGFKVTGVDVDIDKVNKINQGISPIEETGLGELLKKVTGWLKATLDYEEAVLKSDITFIVVATPSLADGSFSNEYLEKALHRIAEALKKKKGYHLVVITSTVMPKTTEQVASFILEKVSGKKFRKDFGLAYNPEFIALGSVIHDFLHPDMVLIGESSKKDGDMLEEVYKKTCESNPAFARMSPLNAEITKISLNCYITTKITFANSLAAICEKTEGADAYVISRALGMDSRIGAKYIRPGLGYGGPCFPRDNQAFAAFARLVNEQAKLAERVDEINRQQVARVVGNIDSLLQAQRKAKKSSLHIGVLGLAYKPNTSVIEDSQALAITQSLTNEGYRVSVYDPQAMENARAVLGAAVRYAKNKEDCLRDASLGVVAVAWEEFKSLNLGAMPSNFILLDCWRIIGAVPGHKVYYLGQGPES